VAEVAALSGLLAQIAVLFSAYAVIALSFNIEFGFTGIPNFGKALFVALGSYAAGSITATVLLSQLRGMLSEQQLQQIAGLGGLEAEGMPVYCTGGARNLLGAAPQFIGMGELMLLFAATAVIAMVLGGLMGVLASYPALRLREDYLAITLLAFSEIFRYITYNSPWPVCGNAGLSGFPHPFTALGLRGDVAYAMLMLVILVGVYLLVDRLTNSPWGRALKAVRDDELAAEVYGYDIARVRMQSLIIGSALAALGGVMVSFYSGSAAAANYDPKLTFDIITAVIVGGTANNVGAVFGAFVIALLSVMLNPSALNIIGITLPESVARALPFTKYVIIGVIILLVLMYRPQGVFPEQPLNTPVVRKAREYVERALHRLASAAGGAAPRAAEGEGGQG